MADTVNLKVSGLYTYYNHLSAVPDGALVKASNIFINRNNVAESRRGFQLYGTAMGSGSTTNAQQLLAYKNRIFRHWAQTLDYDSDGSGTFKDFSFTLTGNITQGSSTITGFTTTSTLKRGMLVTSTAFNPNTTITNIPNNNSIIVSSNALSTATGVTLKFSRIISEVSSGTRIKSIEQNGNLYFTTSQGMQKISSFKTSDLSSAIITDVGVTQALDLNVNLNPNPGFFSQESVVGYRLVWGVKDANQNLLLGAPSSRAVISNPLTPLLINDFNNLLNNLDQQNVSTGIHSQDFLSTLRLSTTSSAQDLSNNLVTLTEKIDNEVSTFTTVSGVIQTQTITTVADVSGNLNSTYFLINSANDATGYYVWFTDGTGVNPNLTNKTGIQVSYTDNATATSIASLVSSALNTVDDFTASSSGDVVTVSNLVVGSSTAAANGAASPQFTFAVTTAGSGGPTIVQNGLYFITWDITTDPTNILRAGDSIAISGITPITFNTPTTDDTYFTITSVNSGLINTTGNVTTSSTTVTNIPDTSEFQVGYIVKGPDIPSGTTISSITNSTTIVLSNAATNTVTGETLSILPSFNITYSQHSAPGKYLTGNATISRKNYENIPQPITLDITPTTDELTSLQTYYNNIVIQLQNEVSGIANNTSLFNENDPTTSSTVDIKFVIPNGITTSYFYQLYRTALTFSQSGTTLSSYDPGDEEGLVYEANPTNTDLNNGYIKITDVTPDAFRGANLYTNPQSGQGINQSNNQPPIAQDVAYYYGYTFLSNTSTNQNMQPSLLSVTNLVSGQSTFTVSNSTISNTYTFVEGVAEVQTITTVADSSGSLNNTYFLIYTGNNTYTYYVWYNNGTGTDPGVSNAIGIEVDYSNNDSATTIAQKTYNKLLINPNFVPTLSSNVITVTNADVGITTSATNGSHSPGFTFSVVTPGDGEDAANKKVLISSLPTPAQQVAETSQSLIRVINQNDNEIINAFYISGPTDIPGLMSFQTRNIADPAFYILTDSSSTGIEFNPNLSPTNTITSISVANPTVITSANHGLTTGTTIMISGSNSTPSIDGQYNVTVINSNTFSIPVHVTSSGTRGGWATLNNIDVSTNEVKPNRLFYSKYQTPDAYPTLNFIDIGSQDKAIVRILALRNSLMILKEEGVYILSGQTAPFTVNLFDSNTIIKGADTAVVLNNVIYTNSYQGISTISDTGVQIISRPIDDLILPISTNNYPNYNSASFGVAYQSDRSYYLFTVTNPSDTFATQCFRYNMFTQTWTTLDLEKSSGIVNPFDDLLYLGATDTNFIEQERKSFDRTDYADRVISSAINANCISGTNITLPSTNNISVGDVLIQTQYLTISKFNQILSKLDKDPILSSRNYVATLTAKPGDDLSNNLDNLKTAIANDPGRLAVSGSFPASDYTSLPSATNLQGQQTLYNSIVGLLNTDVGVGYKNYITSSGSIPYEVILNSLNTQKNIATISYEYPFIQGPISIYNHINIDLQFVPQYFQDVSMTKQVSEGTVIFQNNSFTNGTVYFSTDLSANQEPITIQGGGNGIYGSNVYGQGLYGGTGSSIPFRTFIPKAKQRCRYMNVGFQHNIARETFYLYGISLVFNMISNRGYR